MSKSLKACVIGHPITHSKSPLIHNSWIKKHGLSGEYKAIDIAPEMLEKEVRALAMQGYNGFNVTVPHKESMLKICDHIDENAAAIGAVNTVVIKDQKLFGMNTDGFGFLNNIYQAHPSFKFAKKHVAVLGAGGAARAIIVALCAQGAAKITILNRTTSRAQELKNDLPASMQGVIEVGDWKMRDEALNGTDLLVNTTSLGMNGQAELELSLQHLPLGALVNDIVYAPLRTKLLQNAQERGHPIVTGIAMLLHQARPAFEAWTGILPDVSTALQEQVLK